jgi:DNA-binding SARP family transcriptional activator/tetratricopeptide (TPR) repeat protein
MVPPGVDAAGRFVVALVARCRPGKYWRWARNSFRALPAFTGFLGTDVESSRRQQPVNTPDAGDASAATYVLRTLGALRLEGPAGDVRSLRRKERLLLAFLARAAGPVPRSELTALLWGRSEEGRARQSLRQALLGLRRLLGDALEVGSDAVRLGPGVVALDLAGLEAAVRAGRPAEAASLWGGEFLPGLEDAGDEPLRAWIEDERTTLRSLLAGVLDSLVAAARADGEWPATLDLARRWAEASPGDESAHARLVAALGDAGRLEEAVAWHERAVARLSDELGRAPSPGFLADGQALAERLARRQRELRPTVRTVASPSDRRLALEGVVAAWRAVQAGSGAVVQVEGPAAQATPFWREVVAALGATEPCFVLSSGPGDDATAPEPTTPEPTTPELTAPDPTTPWASAARLLAPLRAAPGLSGVADAALAEVAELVPSIRDRFPQLPHARGGLATGPAARDTLRDVAAEVPVVVAVDGVHQRDPETRRWLALLAGAPPPHVLVVVTAPTGGPAGPEWAGITPTRTIRLTEGDPAPEPLGAEPGVALAAEPDGALATDAATALGADPAIALGADPVPRYRPRRLRRVEALIAVLVAGALVTAVAAVTLARSAPTTPVLAVGAVQALGPAIAEPAVMAMPELLSTQLARIEGLAVVSRGRMQELMATSSGELAAARVAGATEVLEGELFVRDDRHHLEIRRLDARTGRVRAVHSAAAEQPLDLAHAIAVAVAVSLGRAAPGAPSQVPGSVAARALYEAGLQAFYHRQDHRAALQLFSAALDEDPGFGMAALFAARSAGVVEGQQAMSELLARAEAAADDAPERDRLFIRASAALHFNDPAGLPAAEALVRRYPAEPEGQVLLGRFLSQTGRFPEAIVHLRRALANQASQGAEAGGSCPRCDAYAALLHTYWAADSLDAAIRVATDWAALQPTDATPLRSLASLYLAADRYDEAAAARQRASAVASDPGDDILWNARQAIHRGDFAEADASLEFLAGAGNGLALGAAWLQTISLRHQRRYDDAWRAATRYRALSPVPAPAVRPYAMPQAVVLMETGRAAAAAALFDTMFHNIEDQGRASRTARDRAWLLTLHASALAAGGDTVRLPALADQLERLGRMSAYGRDSRLHHHVRGLLLRARGDLQGAERELRAAIYSTTVGFTRTNLELASLLIDLGRPAEALPLLEAALRAPLDGPALYVTRTEVHEMMARARGVERD